MTTPELIQMTDLKMASLIRSSLLGKVSFDTLVRDTKSLGYFLTHFGSLAMAQRDYEAREVEGTQNQLVYSKLMQSYLEIAHMFGMDKVTTAAAHTEESGWSWLMDYTKAMSSLEAIKIRTLANEKYLVSVVGQVDGNSSTTPTGTSADCSGSAVAPPSRTSPELSSTTSTSSTTAKWNFQCDVELMQWSTDIPTDFQLGG